MHVRGSLIWKRGRAAVAEASAHAEAVRTEFESKIAQLQSALREIETAMTGATK